MTTGRTVELIVSCTQYGGHRGYLGQECNYHEPKKNLKETYSVESWLEKWGQTFDRSYNAYKRNCRITTKIESVRRVWSSDGAVRTLD